MDAKAQLAANIKLLMLRPISQAELYDIMGQLRDGPPCTEERVRAAFATIPSSYKYWVRVLVTQSFITEMLQPVAVGAIVEVFTNRIVADGDLVWLNSQCSIELVMRPTYTGLHGKNGVVQSWSLNSRAPRPVVYRVCVVLGCYLEDGDTGNTIAGGATIEIRTTRKVELNTQVWINRWGDLVDSGQGHSSLGRVIQVDMNAEDNPWMTNDPGPR